MGKVPCVYVMRGIVGIGKVLCVCNAWYHRYWEGYRVVILGLQVLDIETLSPLHYSVLLFLVCRPKG